MVLAVRFLAFGRWQVQNRHLVPSFLKFSHCRVESSKRCRFSNLWFKSMTLSSARVNTPDQNATPKPSLHSLTTSIFSSTFYKTSLLYPLFQLLNPKISKAQSDTSCLCFKDGQTVDLWRRPIRPHCALCPTRCRPRRGDGGHGFTGVEHRYRTLRGSFTD